MAIDLTHIGEAFLQHFIAKNPRTFFEYAELSYAEVFGGRVYREVQLDPYCGRAFDGESRVDLVVPISNFEAIPIEVKLGTTRLGKTRVDSEWLSGCRPSHNRWAGNMMSILECRFPAGIPEQPLFVNTSDGRYQLTPNWIVIVRRITAEGWERNGQPAFERAKVVDFDTLIYKLNPSEFNEIVKSLLNFDFYETWIKPGEKLKGKLT